MTRVLLVPVVEAQPQRDLSQSAKYRDSDDLTGVYVQHIVVSGLLPTVDTVYAVWYGSDQVTLENIAS